jgi:hypothetical protein
MRLFLLFIFTAVSATAQTSPFGKKADNEVVTPAPARTAEANLAKAEDEPAVIITPFRELTPPPAQISRTFQLSRVNRLGYTETTKDLQRLYTAIVGQRVVDGSAAGSSKATGYLTQVNYALLQDLGDNRFLAKAAWPAAGPNNALAAGVDTIAILLLEKSAKVGDTGSLTGMHAGTVALRFTADYAPLAGKRLTLRREAFLECTPLTDSPDGLKKFVEAVNAGEEMSAITSEQIPCKKCGSLGFIREPQKGQLLDKRTPCPECAATGKVNVSVETRFVP